MKLPTQSRSGLTLVEMMVTTLLIGALGLIVYSLLSTGTNLGAKNTAVNTAHQQARSAMLHMTQTLHSAVSVPQLIDAIGNPTNVQPAAGISFQVWAMGPLQLIQDTPDATRTVTVNSPRAIKTGQRLIIPGYQVEADIAADAGPGIVTLTLIQPSPAPTPIPITVTSPPKIVTCFITTRCSYIVHNDALEWHGPGMFAPFPVLATVDSSSPLPFSIPILNGPAVVNLPTKDSRYSNQDTRDVYGGFKSTKILLSETIPIRTQLTLLP